MYHAKLHLLAWLHWLVEPEHEDPGQLQCSQPELHSFRSYRSLQSAPAYVSLTSSCFRPLQLVRIAVNGPMMRKELLMMNKLPPGADQICSLESKPREITAHL